MIKLCLFPVILLEFAMQRTYLLTNIYSGVLKDLRKMSPGNQITMLKFIKNLSMLSSTHESLQNSNAIDILIELLKSSKSHPNNREISNQILNSKPPTYDISSSSKEFHPTHLNCVSLTS